MKVLTTTFFSTLDKEQTMDCLKFLLLPWKWKNWKKGKHTEQAEVELQKYLGAKEVFSFYNGRAALYHALRVAGVGVGDEVIIQAYTCVTVPNAVLSTGAKPVYCDVDESLNLDHEELAKKITNKTKVVIVQHTFGNPARIDLIRGICKNPPAPFSKGGNNEIFLIEDCAHSLGAKYNDKLIGTFGDISIFSFGRDKVISSVNGGILCTNNEALVVHKINESAVVETRQCFVSTDVVNNISFPPVLLIARNLMYPIIAQISLKWYNRGSIGKVIMYLSKKLKLFPLILTKEEKNGTVLDEEIYKMPSILAYLFLKQFKKLEEYNEHRRKIADYYNKILAGTEFKLPKIWGQSEPIYLRYTILSDRAKELIDSAKKQNIYLGDWYRQVIAPRGVNFSAVYYEQNMCSKAEKYSSLTLNLPNHSGIDLEEAEKVIMEIKKLRN